MNGAKQQIQTAGDITGRDLALSSTSAQQSADEYKQFHDLIAPLIAKNTALATGDRSEALKAAMPTISKLSAGWEGAKQGIMNAVPAGAARDMAMADTVRNMYSAIGGAQAGMVDQAPAVLAEVGSHVAGDSLQRLGAAGSFNQGATASNNAAMQAAVAQQQAKLNFFSNLVGSAAGAVAGPAGKLLAQSISKPKIPAGTGGGGWSGGWASADA